ncbi:hypothetical protein ES703_105449 [subsurface metagenome]
MLTENQDANLMSIVGLKTSWTKTRSIKVRTVLVIIANWPLPLKKAWNTLFMRDLIISSVKAPMRLPRIPIREPTAQRSSRPTYMAAPRNPPKITASNWDMEYMVVNVDPRT